MAQRKVLARTQSATTMQKVGELLGHVRRAHVSPLIAIAMTLFAASSVAALAGLAQVELASAEYMPTPTHKVAFAGGRVLGETVYSPITIFAKSNLTLKVTPGSYDSASGKWSYKISWDRISGRTGSIAINDTVVVASAKGQGSADTGFILNPDSKTRVTYYSQEDGKGVKIVNHRSFTTLSAPTTVDTVDQEDDQPEADMDMKVKEKDGKDVRMGKLVLIDKTVYLVTGRGLMIIPSMDTFNSWCFSLKEVLPATPAEKELPRVGVVGNAQRDKNGAISKELKTKTCEMPRPEKEPFGLSKEKNASSTPDGSASGTPPRMTPSVEHPAEDR